jgi:hypothetical protein
MSEVPMKGPHVCRMSLLATGEMRVTVADTYAPTVVHRGLGLM